MEMRDGKGDMVAMTHGDVVDGGEPLLGIAASVFSGMLSPVGTGPATGTWARARPSRRRRLHRACACEHSVGFGGGQLLPVLSG
jgi:hypothetical protein